MRRWRDHVVIIGATPFADALGEKVLSTKKKGLRCVQLCDVDSIRSFQGRLVRLPFDGLPSDDIEESGAVKARKIVIALEDDGQAIDFAFETRRRCPSADLVVRLRDARLARCLHALPTGRKLRVFSEAESAASEIIRRHPPYLVAQDLGRDRIHLMLAGDPEWIEAIMVETIVSACTLKYGKPAFTLFTSNPDDVRRALAARYPELGVVAETAFADMAGGPHALLAADWPERLLPAGPVTGVYCAFADGGYRALAAAIALRDQAADLDGFTAPVFVRLSRGGALDRPPPGSRLASGALVSFGGLNDVARAAGLLSPVARQAERVWHACYRQMNPSGGAADRPWEDLDEEYRMANRRAVAHINAKLFEAGFDIRPWLAREDYWRELPSLAPGESLFRNDLELARLAAQEHESWSADRRLQGWRHGPTRDDARRIHPDLKPFGELDEKTRSFDYGFIRRLDQLLRREAGGLARPVDSDARK